MGNAQHMHVNLGVVNSMGLVDPRDSCPFSLPHACPAWMHELGTALASWDMKMQVVVTDHLNTGHGAPAGSAVAHRMANWLTMCNCTVKTDFQKMQKGLTCGWIAQHVVANTVDAIDDEEAWENLNNEHAADEHANQLLMVEAMRLTRSTEVMTKDSLATDWNLYDLCFADPGLGARVGVCMADQAMVHLALRLKNLHAVLTNQGALLEEKFAGGNQCALMDDGGLPNNAVNSMAAPTDVHACGPGANANLQARKAWVRQPLPMIVNTQTTCHVGYHWFSTVLAVVDLDT